MSQEGLKAAAIKAKAKACIGCPLRRQIWAEAPSHALHRNVAATKVRIACGGCNGAEVKPPSVTSHTECSRYKKAA